MELSTILLIAYLMLFIVSVCAAPFIEKMNLYLTIMVPVLVLLAIALAVYTYFVKKGGLMSQNSDENKKHA